MKRTVIATLGLLALASTAAVADPDYGPRYRDLARQNREARDAAPPPVKPVPPQVVRQDDRGPRFARDEDRRNDRRDDRRNDRRDDRHRDDRYRDDRRGEAHRWDDRHRDDRRWDDRRWDDHRGRDERRSHRHYRDSRGRAWHYEPHWYQSWRHQHYRFDRGRYYARERFHVGIYVVPRGYVQRIWRTGDWLPHGYWRDTARYELRSWWRYGLYDPPYWATWVRVGDDALLIDRGNGEVVDVVYDLFW